MMVSLEEIEGYVKQRMANRELLTWSFDDERQEVTFFIPEDVDQDSYPEEIGGVPVIVRKLPRPILFSGVGDP